MAHLLNLSELAGEALDRYSLLGFEGREAISEPFDYRLEILTDAEPDLTQWIGKLAEFDVRPHDGPRRVFAGRIFAARRVESGDERRILVQVRPAFHAMSYARATHFVQDKQTIDIFEALTKDVPGLVKAGSVDPLPPKRGYAVRYDETEIEFLSRLFAQDGIMYFFAYDRGAGPYRHRMIVTNKPADYIDAPGGEAVFHPLEEGAAIGQLERQYRAAPRKRRHAGYNVNNLDAAFASTAAASEKWGAVYTETFDTTAIEAVAAGDVKPRAEASDQHAAHDADVIEGRGTDPGFQAGSRVSIVAARRDAAKLAPKRVVLTTVTHSAYDPWMLEGAPGARYANSFTAIDADRVYRPAIAPHDRRAPGPVIGVIADKATKAGQTVIDDQFRVPVEILHARDYSDRGLPKYVWLPVQQQWAHGTHGAQFFPRIGSTVIVDFLYGNPDLPFISGSMYTPTRAYPFDPRSTPTQSGWRSVTDENGSITQEFRFEDKPGAEEIYLYTGRDYRRLIDQDDWGTVKRDQTLAVERDQKLTVTRDRTVKIDGKQTTDVAQTRDLIVTQKSFHESKQEIEFKVGQSSIKLTLTGIEIKAPQITIKAEATLDVSAGAMSKHKAPMVQVNADGMMILKGGMVMIN